MYKWLDRYHEQSIDLYHLTVSCLGIQATNIICFVMYKWLDRYHEQSIDLYQLTVSCLGIQATNISWQSDDTTLNSLRPCTMVGFVFQRNKDQAVYGMRSGYRQIEILKKKKTKKKTTTAKQMTFGFRMLGVHFYKIIMSKNTSTRNFQDLFCKIHDWNFLKKMSCGSDTLRTKLDSRKKTTDKEK